MTDRWFYSGTDGSDWEDIPEVDDLLPFIPLMIEDKRSLKTKKLKQHVKDSEKRIPLSKTERLDVFIRARNKCEHCGMGAKDYLQIHHRDGNPSNNATYNLEALCYACHKFADAQVKYRKLRAEVNPKWKED